jgi:hypothetical protein
MDWNRVLELALESLESKKEAVLAEMETVRSELKGIGTGNASARKTSTLSGGGKRSKSPAERKAHSERMKKYWVARKGKSAAAKKSDAKKVGRAKAPARIKAKSSPKPKTAAAVRRAKSEASAG